MNGPDMRVLAVCDSAPFPLTNGQNLRIYNYVRELKSRHAFDLLYLGVDAPNPALREWFGEIRVLPPFPHAAAGGYLKRLSLAGGQLVLPHPSLAATLTELACTGVYDLLWFSGGGTMNSHFAHANGVAVLADVVDSLTLTQLREFRRARTLVDQLRQGKRLIATGMFERKVFRHADQALFVSEVDAAMFSRLCPNVPVSVVHNGVDERFFCPDGARNRSQVLAFEGNMGFGPNIEAAEWFCHAVLPIALALRPEVRLTIIGKDPPQRVQRLAGDSVEVTGTVDDVRPYLRRAAVFVCPMQSGAGIKNKILQAWAMGLPTVATRIATGGLDVIDGVNILIEDEPQRFAERVVQLLDDADRADQIGAAARETILGRYSWSQKAEELERVFELAHDGGAVRIRHGR